MGLLKKIRSSSFVRRTVGFCIAQYVRFVWVTGKWEHLNKEFPELYWRQNKSVIACFWHGRLLMMFKAWFGLHKLHMLISSHPDGEIIARTTQNFGYGWIAGSSTRGGRKALLATVKILKGGESAGITPDGPRGPRYHASLGVIQMARLGGAAIMPISYSCTRGKFMRSWDRFFLPFPFGRGVIIYGPLLEVANSSKSDEELCLELESSLNDLTQRADRYCNQEDSMKEL